MITNGTNNFFNDYFGFSQNDFREERWKVRKIAPKKMVANTLVHLSTVQIRLFSNRNINRANQ